MKAYNGIESIKRSALHKLSHEGPCYKLTIQYGHNGHSSGRNLDPDYEDSQIFESKFGIPVILLHLSNRILVRLPQPYNWEWTYTFMSAIKVGSDLSKIWAKFIVWQLSDPDYGTMKTYNYPECREAVAYVANLFKDSIERVVGNAEWHEALNKLRYHPVHITHAYAAILDTSAVSADAAAYELVKSGLFSTESYAVIQSKKLLELLRDA